LFITDIELVDFRNYSNTQINFSKKIVILLGKNAQGKTSFLESILLASTARSPIEKKNYNLIKFGNNKANIKVKFNNYRKQNNTINMIIDHNYKTVMVNKIKINKTSELLGNFNTVYISPIDMELIQGEPSYRRNFLDRFNFQIINKYAYLIKNYKEQLKNRNAFIKEKNIDKVYLDVIDKEIVNIGIKIIKYRNNAIEYINDILSKKFVDIFDNINIKYLPGAPIDSKSYLDKLKKNLEKDISFGTTTTGPHRDNFLTQINNNDARLFASNGQKRLLSLALKIAETDYIQYKTHESPIVLIDDALLELDKNNLTKIINLFLNYEQIILTTTTLENLPENIIQQAEVVEVENGIPQKRLYGTVAK